MKSTHRIATLAVLAASIVVSGCVTLRPAGQRPSADARVIQSVPVRTWGDNTCGAAALATVLDFYGSKATEEELIRSLDRGRHGGVVSVDLLLAARKRGFGAELVRGDRTLVTDAVAKQQPVILMLRILDVPGAATDLYHYIVVDGVDPSRGLIRTQFGDGRLRWIDFDRIERAWKGAGYATILLDRTPHAPRSYHAELRKAVALEEAGNPDAAILVYQSLLAERPRDALLWTNLANAQREAHASTEAEEAYRRALAIDPADRDALNNLAWLLYEQKRYDEAEPLARLAATLPGPDPDVMFDTLGHIQLARGDCLGAIGSFREAEKTSGNTDAAGRSIKEAEQLCRGGLRTDAAPSPQ
ncbi:MAG: tetratricopeptide repeat protein [Thermoanaerobaculia bacterium]